MEDCCAICAEPTHVAYGPCGHRDACVECVARLRFVMEDRRCVICQVPCERVFATRHMGEYTETIGADGFEQLPKRARAKQLHHDDKLDMYFDDDAVCGKVKSLRSLVCGECVRGGRRRLRGPAASERQGPEGAPPREARQVLLRGVPRGTQVFLSEQLLYTRTQLDKHRYGASADVDHAFGHAGFKGHPSCKYCRKFFYDEGQLYTHMQTAHETCHICRRQCPDKHVYYRDYEELERHFRKDHHACLHPECLAKKFVVFTSAQELKNHEGLEHGRAMTKAERQAALRVDVGFTVGAGGRRPGTGGTRRGVGSGGGGRGGRTRPTSSARAPGARPRAGATATGAGEQRRERAARGCAPRVARGRGATEGGVRGGFSRFGIQRWRDSTEAA